MLCRGCGLPIVDQYLMKVGDVYWHERCVKCSTCGCDLNEKCFQKFGLLHCAEDYFRQYSIHRCFACGQGISPHDMVYKLKSDVICHIRCQRCFVCGIELGAGARICIDQRNRHLLCVLHAEQGTDFAGTTSTSYLSNHCGTSSAPIVCSSFVVSSTSSSSVIKAEASSPVSPPGCSTTGRRASFSDSGSVKAVSSSGSTSRDEQRQQQQILVGGSCSSSRYVRRRGPRTTIRPMQLETLNRIFGTTPKPSKQARARLALETGLSMRVIQFQNRRSKERRLKHLCNWIRQNEGRSAAASGGTAGGASLMTPLLNADLPLTDDDQGSGIDDLLESESDSSDKESDKRK